MAVKAYKPTTPARRGMTTQDFDKITARSQSKAFWFHARKKLVATIKVK